MAKPLQVLLGILAAINVAASQQLPIGAFQALLPAGAEIIETADLTAVAPRPRVIALWMLRPSRNLDDKANKNQAGGYCSDMASGDFGKFWKGPTRLSLIDSAEMKLINTIEIRASCLGCKAQDAFQIPLCVLNPYAHGWTPTPDRTEKPNLDLKDLTGEGLKADFALFEFEAFSIVSTGVFGYEPKSDRVMQYPIEMQSPKKHLRTLWTEQVFAREPVRPGYWDFTWQPGHGDPNTYREEVLFDRKRLVFLQKTSRVSNPDQQ